MRLLSLNLWGGRQGNLLFDYLKQQAATTDIFCFQEVFSTQSEIKNYKSARINLFGELCSLLTGYQPLFSKTYTGWVDRQPVGFEVAEGQAMFVKKPIAIREHGQIYIHGSEITQITPDFTNEPKDLQYQILNFGGGDFMIANVHGMWHPGEKLDTPQRLEQSKKIRALTDSFAGPKIVCGDFNLMPGTASVKILEENLVNLIKQYNITNTRNEVSWKEFGTKQHFADYTFVSPEVKVTSFEVPYNLVSDHLPLVLNFDL